VYEVVRERGTSGNVGISRRSAPIATAPVNARATDLDGDVDGAVPDPLLLPLIEVAADALREMEIGDAPGFSPTAARLRPARPAGRARTAPAPAALVADEGFRAAVVEKFLARLGGRRDARRVGRPIRPRRPSPRRQRRGDLPLYTSTLWVAAARRLTRSASWIAVVLDAQQRERQRDADEGKSLSQERAALEEARRRSDASRIEAEAPRRAEQELQKERSTRRSREDDAIAAAGAAQRQVDALHTQLDQAHAEVEEQQNNANARIAARAFAGRRSAARARRHPRAPGAPRAPSRG